MLSATWPTSPKVPVGEVRAVDVVSPETGTAGVLASSVASVGPALPLVPVPLMASGQVNVTDPFAATVTVWTAEGSDSPYAVAAVIS